MLNCNGSICQSRQKYDRCTLADFARANICERWYTWAFANYKHTVVAISRTFGLNSLLEIGGGRSPLFTQKEVQKLGVCYTVNDISQSELDLCPTWVRRVRFDIGGDVPSGRYDLIFSRMVLEHVESAENVYKNVYTLLRPGGVALNFHPTLYASPFSINYILPTWLSSGLMSAFSRATESEEAYPKFPARYSWCESSERIRRKIIGIGFHEVLVVPFYGHGYFRHVPILFSIDNLLSKAAEARNSRFYSSYVFSIARK